MSVTYIIELKNKLSKRRKGTRSYMKTKTELDELVLEELKKNNPKIEEILRRNQELLSNTRIKFKVYKEGSSYFGTHATKLEGKMHKNGFVYVEATKTMFPFIPFAQKMFPVKFKGKIKWDGSIELKVSERSFSLVGSRVPEEFIGDIDSVGNVEIEMVDSSFEWSGERYLHKLIFDPFNGNESNRTKFIDDTIYLKQEILSYLEGI